jgi:hypothetical protein
LPEAVDSLLRVSAAALCRVIFSDPQTGEQLLALERRATWTDLMDRVLAQPFGGALRILYPADFRAAVGDFTYDSVRSSEEQDLRILISPAAWETTRKFIVAQMGLKHPDVIETDPCRELEEEFAEAVGITLMPEYYTYRPIGISIQDVPIATTNLRMPGAMTARIYRIFEVMIYDLEVSKALIETNRRGTDENLLALAKEDAAVRGETGRANGALVLPLAQVRHAYHMLPSPTAFQPMTIQGHQLDATASLVLFE